MGVNGIHDLGGMHGMGAIVREEDEPVFHHAWERRTLALARAMMAAGHFNLDEFRHGIERMDPAHYLRSSYYEHWLDGVERLLLEKGTITREELEGRVPAGKGGAPASVVTVEMVRGLYKTSGASRMDVSVAPRFEPGQRIVARNIQPTGHTRLPAYVRAKRGLIERDHGVFHCPDARVQSKDDKPQHIYGVRFSARELWGPEAPDRDSLRIDLWDDYMDPA